MSRVFAVISAIGADRVGIVDELSGLISEAGGNVEESKMAVLGGDFSVMMLISLEQKALESLLSRIGEMEKGLGLKVGITPTKETALRADGRPYSLETVSLDGRGILHAVSAILHHHGVNIEELETSTEGAPLTGAPLFRLRASIVLGAGVHVAALRSELEALENARELDISLTPLVPSRD
ncbi:MAG: amino acid-binding protein [Treponema sp.]|nr:amino acid-binding protein [Treponema sp.]